MFRIFHTSFNIRTSFIYTSVFLIISGQANKQEDRGPPTGTKDKDD